MTYHVLTQQYTVIARSTVQRVTNLELNTNKVKEIFSEFDQNIATKFKTSEFGYDGDKPNPEDWADLIADDEDFQDEFQKTFNNNDIKEAYEAYTEETLDNTYLNIEITLPRDSEGPEYAKVTKRLRDANGIPIGTANDNPILDSCLYEVEYIDGYKAALTANTIAENLFSQVDNEGNRHVLFDAIIDHRRDSTALQQDDAFVISANGGRHRQETTKGWEILIQWKDGSTSWETLKDVKHAHPVQLAEYALQRQITNEPAFAWWCPYVLKKRSRIISKTKSKYWCRTHKFGIFIPKTVQQALDEDAQNGNHLWWDGVCKEMKNVRIAFELYETNTSHEDAITDLKSKGYQQIDCHIILISRWVRTSGGKPGWLLEDIKLPHHHISLIHLLCLVTV